MGCYVHNVQLVCPSRGCVPGDCVELTDREVSVCSVICDSAEPVSFTQLKDATDLHQEIISRVVRRLAIYGLVTKVEGRYKGNCCQPSITGSDSHGLSLRVA